MLVMLLAAGVLAACGATAKTETHLSPAQLRPIDGTDLKQLVLTEDAVRRLAIQTAPVREEQVARKRIVGGEVMAAPEASQTVSATSAGTIAVPAGGALPATGTSLAASQVVVQIIPSGANKRPIDVKAPRAATLAQMLVVPGQMVETGQALFQVADISKVIVRALVYAGEVDKVDRAKPGLVLPVNSGDQANSLTAKAVEIPEVSGAPASAVYYLVDSANHGLVPGQRVRVEFSLLGSGAQQKVVPYASVIYDLKGDTWAYVNTQPLTFVREHLAVDYIDGELAVVSQGPATGTPVVTVGAAELFGTEFGVGK
jgi:biotin carboxyl carrier protein